MCQIINTSIKQSFCLWVQTELSLSQRKMCCELSKLKGEEVEEAAAEASSSFSALQVRLLLHAFGFMSQHVLDSVVAEPSTYLRLPVSRVKCLNVLLEAQVRVTMV